ncbi:uncharacterized protein SCODWIG_00762 [Saccharomycodes ludwigii]|uniref:Cell cycle arrest protein BUB3 n=1 Tax=Saccharomycodes ludwigii TaxID=36035 RepID=A0A376B2X5_9ASCO|nr:hypothetical protein SCDLUD_004874 [Saccharomycodes ludwigii]KAH3899431.1 hypothetical protein SCDLUD_004874 [Saccharomycodes ludwigii]SSD59001.1 uncharacterized protein SCODWIG_00762 [Saccharomycodes ludwigii]
MFQVIDEQDDIVSSLNVHTNNNKTIITTTNWKGELRLYDADNSNTTTTSTNKPYLIDNLQFKYPLLSCDPITAYKYYLGDVQGNIIHLDYNYDTPVVNTITKNKNAVTSDKALGICSIKNDPRLSLLITSSWNGVINLIDYRTDLVENSLQLTLDSNSTNNQIQKQCKIFNMDYNSNSNLLVSTITNNLVDIRDIRKLDTPYQLRESGLRDQVRDLKIMPNGSGFAQSSMAGRVAIEYFNNNDNCKLKYGFRCHRINLKDMDFVYPVNSICFGGVGTANSTPHGNNILYTGGSDGVVNKWDYIKKKKLKTFKNFNIANTDNENNIQVNNDNQSVVKLACNEKFLVVATSDDSYKTYPSIIPNEDGLFLSKSKIYMHHI